MFEVLDTFGIIQQEIPEQRNVVDPQIAKD